MCGIPPDDDFADDRRRGFLAVGCWRVARALYTADAQKTGADSPNIAWPCWPSSTEASPVALPSQQLIIPFVFNKWRPDDLPWRLAAERLRSRSMGIRIFNQMEIIILTCSHKSQ
jgi:hypothetical protein